MKRGGPLQRHTGLNRKTPLNVVGHSDTAQLKEAIQVELRRIVIARDDGCVLRDSYDVPSCGGYANDGHLILQADHLITRANSATFADPRLVVTVCKAHHGWKSVGSNRNKSQYDAAVRKVLSEERVRLWDACEKDSWRPARTSASDWAKELAYLRTL